MTVPAARRWGSAFSSCMSAVRATISTRWATPSFFVAETGSTGVSPPHWSQLSPSVASWFRTRSRLACCLSILLSATTMGTPAARAWLMASSVWGMTPSSAATTRMTTSATLAPRARMAVKASWPGVSRKVTRRPPSVVTW
jgi:hypothetical protein